MKINSSYILLKEIRCYAYHGVAPLSKKLIGVDAHIDPAVQTDFTEIQCEFDGTQWGDVGIDPYALVVIE